MFDLFFRRYEPGFRVGADGVPGFDIDETALKTGVRLMVESALDYLER